MKLAVATRNPGKLREIRALLEPKGVEAVGLDEFETISMPDEDGETFLENARNKARAVASATGLPALADDSGLAVDALGGRPGVRSARYGGPGCSAAENNRKLLEELQGVPQGSRAAAFVCAMVLVLPGGREIAAQGRLTGEILEHPRGEGGFGYDPLFLVPSMGKTLAELEPEAKNRLSHRGQALRGLLPHLADMGSEAAAPVA